MTQVVLYLVFMRERSSRQHRDPSPMIVRIEGQAPPGAQQRAIRQEDPSTTPTRSAGTGFPTQPPAGGALGSPAWRQMPWGPLYLAPGGAPWQRYWCSE